MKLGNGLDHSLVATIFKSLIVKIPRLMIQ